MTTNGIGRTLLAVGLVLLTGGARGERARTTPPAEERRPPEEKLRNEILDQMRAVRMWKLTEALKLDETTAAKVFPLLAKYDEQERNLMQERADITRDLKTAVEAPVEPAKIDALIDRLIAVRARRRAMDSEKTIALRRVLTPVQMGKLMVVAPRIDEAFRRQIRDAVEGVRLGDTKAKPDAP